MTYDPVTYLTILKMKKDTKMYPFNIVISNELLYFLTTDMHQAHFTSFIIKINFRFLEKKIS